jgi:transposase
VTRIAQLEPTRVTVGVDTHRDAHVAVALDQLGRRLGQLEIATTRAGYAQLLAWAESFGEVVVFAVEGCGCYGAGLARHLGAQHVRVVEVMRANRQTRRRKGKSDPTDAEAAGRAVLAGEAAAAPKSGDDVVEMIRVLRVVRVTAMKARTQAINALRSLLVTAPPELRDQLRALSSVKLVRSAARFRPGAQDSPLAASKLALRLLARRYQALDDEIAELDAQLEQLTAQASPHLIESFGVGPEAAAALLIAAGDNPGRLRPSRCSAAPHRSQPHRAKPFATASTEAATAKPTPPSTASSSSACATTSRPRTTSTGAPARARASRRSSAASNATSPARSTQRSSKQAKRTSPEPFDIYRSITLRAKASRVRGG